MNKSTAPHDYAWIILAGGQGRRMKGQDKGWVIYQGEAFIVRVINMLRALNPEIPIVISANRNVNKYRALGCEVIEDQQKGYQGPLEGVVSVMSNSVCQPQKGWLTWPVDSPDCPDLYLNKMALKNTQKICVAYQTECQQYQYTHLCLAVNILPELKTYLTAGGHSIHGFIKQNKQNDNRVNVVYFEQQQQAWKNVNTLEEIE